jgi:hypothetical protein
LPVLQRHAVEKLHGDEVQAVAVVNLVHDADVGMVQRGCGLGLTLEAGKSLRVPGDFIGQEFQGDEAVQLDIFGL